MTANPSITTALLRGREHTLLGGVSTIAEGPAAIALSRGGARKTYAYKDPNEDDAAFATSPWGALLAVADGHSGHGASEVALERLLEAHAPRWLDASAIALAGRWVDEAADVLLDLNTAVLARLTPRGEAEARTTLALALARPGDDLLAFVSMGDSHIFGADRDGARELGAAASKRVAYLGRPDEEREALRRKHRAGVESLGDLRALVLATDGLSEHGIGVGDAAAAVGQVVRRCEAAKPDLRPLEVARGLAELALEAQRTHSAGDNVATAVLWIP